MSFRGRDSDALFSRAAEEGNITGNNGVLSQLFAHKDEMARRTEQQLSGLLRNTGSGRVRNLGPTAAEESNRLKTMMRATGGC
jgi:hypothetical protein